MRPGPNESEDAIRHRKQKRLDEIKVALRRYEGLFEVVMLTAAYYFFCWLFYNEPVISYYFYNGKVLLAAVYGVLLFILFYYGESFQFGHLKTTDIFISQWIAVVIANVITYFQISLIPRRLLNPCPMILLTLLEFGLSLLFCVTFDRIYRRLCVPRKMALIYATESAIQLREKMDKRKDKYNIAGMLSTKELELEEITAQIGQYDAVCINDDVDTALRDKLVKYCYRNSLRTYLVPVMSDLIYEGGSNIMLFDTPLRLVRGKGLTPAQRGMKRLADIILSVAAIPVLLLITLVVAAAIKLEDGGPVFFRQERLTRDKRPFQMLKFRSMVIDAEAGGGPQLAAQQDPRITKVGRIIRKFRIDELPQIFNILRGDMSFVGPRPERPVYYERFREELPDYVCRTKVKGGLTGMAQVYGKYNTTPKDKLKFDLMYIEKYSFFLDIKLMLMTIRILFKKESTEGVKKLTEGAKR